MESITRFFRQVRYLYKRSAIVSDWKTYALFDLANPVTQIICFAFIANYIYGVDYIKNWMIGNVILIASFGALYRVGTQLLIEKFEGTLNLLIVSKTSLMKIFLANMISTFVTSLFSVLIGLITVSLIFNISWSIELFLSIILVIMIATFVAMSFGMIFSCFILVTRETNLIINIVSRVLFILTGANFPLSKLPLFLQYFAQFLPLTRSVFVAQKLMSGQPLSAFYSMVGWECFIGIVFLISTAILLEVMKSIARKRGTIEFY